MPYDFLNNNPLLADMSPEKLQFLMNFATAKKPTDIKEMMPFLLSAMNSAKSNNIQFSEPEEMPPCSEEIAIADDNVYVLFESASLRYFEGTDGKGNSSSPIDKVLEVTVASIW